MKSNLFNMDEEAILRILREANEKLFARREHLFRRIHDVDAMGNASERNDAVKHLRNLEKDIKRARANDGRSFRSATKTVSAFFLDLLGPVEESISSLTKQASEQRTVDGLSSTPVGVSPDGEVVCEARPRPKPLDAFEEGWEVTAINFSEIDLNQLKEFFTEHQVQMALNKHLKRHGPNRLAGVRYTKQLKPR